MATIRGTTPIFTISISGIDLSKNYRVYVTIDQNGTQLTKNSYDNADTLSVKATTDDEGTVTTSIEMSLTQKETLDFEIGKADMQAKWIDSSGVVDASDISSVEFSRALLEEVIKA